MTAHCGRVLFRFFPSSNLHPLSLEPLKGFLSDKVPFMGPQPNHTSLMYRRLTEVWVDVTDAF